MTSCYSEKRIGISSPRIRVSTNLKLDFIRTRTTGNGGGFLIFGPGWDGETPDGIEKVIRSETEWVYAVYRTQLFNADDLENVKQIQDRYQIQPLFSFIGTSAPETAPEAQFIEPLTQMNYNLAFF